ncbi:glycoside hydrolase family protein [Saccharicrinis aurantiacus]|uniref:hypothetical protein n=1 Tax=Saccharicrinis aurantiacus TaxID=1849719 RepID=UPI000837E65A|nr:hypothetical protein [Saccharicrinis aurantiacus]
MKIIYKSLYLTLVAILALSCSNELEHPDQEESIYELKATSVPTIYNNGHFYKGPSANINKVTFSGSTSAELNNLINTKSRSGGAIITITKGTYKWNNIQLKSNIHLQIDKDVIIKPETNSTSRIFNLGGNSTNNGRIENVSIVGNGGRFTVDISNANFTNKNITIVKLGRVDNFKLNNFTIIDRRSSVASIVLAYIGGTDEIKPWASNGVIQNINQTNSHTGYGLIQCYGGDNILFKGLSCRGGVTLRCETDDRTMKNEIKNGEKKGGISNIFAYNIKCTSGIAPLMFSPHFTTNGKVTMQKIEATGCAFAVRIEHGFIELFDEDNTYSTNNQSNGNLFKNFIESQFNLPSGVKATTGSAYKRNNGTQWAIRLSAAAINANRNTYVKKQLGNLIAGQFSNSNITDITATYKNNNGAKIKQSQLKYIPSNQWTKIKNPTTSLGMFNGFEYHGPSVALSIDATNGTSKDGNYIIRLNNQKFNNFPSSHIQNIKYNTAALSNNNPNTINTYNASF